MGLSYKNYLVPRPLEEPRSGHDINANTSHPENKYSTGYHCQFSLMYAMTPTHGCLGTRVPQVSSIYLAGKL